MGDLTMEQHARKLSEPGLSIQMKYELAKQVKDNFEFVYGSEYLRFLKSHFWVLSNMLLYQIEPHVMENSHQHKLRHLIIEILSKLPHNQVLRPYVQHLLRVATHVLGTDNEENGLVCLRIIRDLHRSFTSTLEPEVQPFLDFTRTVYQNFKAIVNYCFNESNGNDSQLATNQYSIRYISPQRLTGGPIPGQLNPSTMSLKIVTECPLIITILFIFHGHYMQKNVPALLPLMVDTISIPDPQHVSPHLKNCYVDLKSAQVKTISCLTYLLGSFADSIRPYEETISKSIVNLLVTCPDSVLIRRELLCDAMQVLKRDFGRGYFPLIDTLLEERVLVGTGRACETLKPLAYDILAEVIQHVRFKVSFKQLSQAINLFSRNLHDSSLSFSTQTTSARLMLNLVKPIFSTGVDPTSKEKSRALQGIILEAFVSKFSTLKHTIPQLIGDYEDGKEQYSLRLKLELPVQTALNLQKPLGLSQELKDCKKLIRTLIIGMKTLVCSISHANTSEMQASQSSSSGSSHGLEGMREDEVRLTSGVLKNGVHCLSIFKDKEEEREILVNFSQIFTGMKNRDLMDMFAMCMPYLFECMLKNDQLLSVYSNLLQTAQVVRYIADVLVNFLVHSKLDTLKQPDTPASKLALRLFHLLFVAVTKFSGDCECVLQPYVSTIVDTCVKNASEIEKPHGYMQLLHSMFRALSRAKFELLFREFIPTLHPCLNLLLTMVDGPVGLDMKDLVLELCLRIPARLSSLLSYLPRLMKPLVLALKGSDELIGLGLRTLEFWIDNLKPEFLEHSMGDVISEINLTLWSHIRPKPYRWGEKALQLLGKLGGKNRRFLKEPLALECKEYPEYGLRIILTFEPPTQHLVPLDQYIYLARATVMQNRSDVDASQKRHALQFLRVCLSSVLNLKGNNPGGVIPGLLSRMLMSSIDPSRHGTETSNMKDDPGVKTKTQLMAEQSVFKVLLMTVIAASAEPELQDPNDEFVPNICRHFSMIFHVDSSTTSPSATSGQLEDLMGGANGGLSSTSQSSCHSNLEELDPLIFLDALVDLLAAENRAHANAALIAMNIFVKTLIFLACSKHTVVLAESSIGTPGTPVMVTCPSMNPVLAPPLGVHIPVFEQLLPRLLHCCYGSTWEARMGGVMGLGALVGKSTRETLCHFQVQAVRSLVYVLQRLPQHAYKEQAETSHVLTHLLGDVNDAAEKSSEHHRQSFQGVVDFLAAELFNPNATLTVRKTVESCLEFLASQTSIEVSELLEPVYQPLLRQLIMHPIRSKGIEQQVGTLMAINYCLSLQPPLLKMSQEFVSVLQVALQITEEDENPSARKFTIPNLAKLRTVCIELLCTAMAQTDFQIPNHTEMRDRIISMLFKSLKCGNPEIVTVARDSLHQLMQQHNLPRELIKYNVTQYFLKSVNTGNFTLPLLQGLARLLELRSNFFSINFGERLLEHLKRWQEKKLDKRQKFWNAAEEPIIVAAIIDLFHLMPPAARKLMDDLVVLTLELEAALPQEQVYSELNSPYHLPLTKFLNCYASDAVDYFLVRLNQPKHFRRFMDIIRSEAGQPLREELAKSSDKIIANAFLQVIWKSNEPVNYTARPCEARNEYALASSRTDNFVGMQSTGESAGYMPDAHFHGISLVLALVKLIPEWLYNNRPVFDALVVVWKSSSRQTNVLNEQNLSLEQVKERKRLVKCFLNYLRHDKYEVGILFDMLSIFLVRTRIDYTFLKEFYVIEVAEGYTPSMKKAILIEFLSLFQSKALTQNQIVVAMQMLILPMLVHAFENGQNSDVVDSSIIEIIVQNLLDPPGKVSTEYDEALRIELLQLATLLLKYLPNYLLDHKQKVFNFGWNNLKEDGVASKQWAFVNVCHFLTTYEPDDEFLLKVYRPLLRMYQPKRKVLAEQALDILIPALARKLHSEEYMIPSWIFCTKKILVEKGQSFDNLIHIFRLIVRHSRLFYSWRAEFVPQLVNSLTRFELGQNNSLENICLSIKVSGVVVAWEKRRQAEAKAASDTGHIQLVNTACSTLAVAGDFIKEAIKSKQLSNALKFSDDLTKRVKTETVLPTLGVMSPSRTSTPNMGSPVSAARRAEFKPNSAMQEVIINFLIRVALVTEHKDKEMSAVHKQAIETLSQALEVWPTANVKFNYLEDLLRSSQPLGKSKDVSTGLAQRLDVMNKVLEKQPRLFILNNFQRITQLLGPCFDSKVMEIGKSLCTLLKMVFDAFPLDAANTRHDIRLLYLKVEELIQKQLAVVSAPQISHDNRSVNLMISFAVSVIKTLAEGQQSFIDSFMMPLIHVLQFLTREIRMLTSSFTKQLHRTNREPSGATEYLKSDLDAVTSNMKSILKLIGGRGMLVPEYKCLISQIVQSILSEKGTDASVLLTILHMVKDWIEDLRSSSSGTYSIDLNKDIILHLERLSQVDRQNLSTLILEEWDREYLQLLHRLCSDSTMCTLPVGQEVFQKVERKHMLGLRAKDPEMRQKFLSIYHQSLGKTVFTRLEYIIQTQEWEALSDVFWLKQGLDLLLAMSVENESIKLAPTSALLPPLIVSGAIPEHAVMHQVGDTREGIAAKPSFTELVNKHARFLNDASKLQVADILIPLSNLAHTDANVAYHLWVLVFSFAWCSLQNEEQKMLVIPMITLLSKDYHIRQKDKRPNVIQALLEGLYYSNPRPKIPSQLLTFLGKRYNAWHIAAAIMESHVMLYPDETSCSEALAELYHMLNEEDLRYGLWKKNMITTEMKAGLSLVQHGYWQRAQDLFFKLMSQATQGTYNNNVSKAEITFCEEHWISCARQLNQWELLVDYAKDIKNYDILLDCLWKIPDWVFLKENVLSKAQVEDASKVHIVRVYMALHDRSITGVTEDGNTFASVIDLALNHWWQLPEMSVESHVPLLQQFQQLVELQESARVLVEIENGNNQHVGTTTLGGVNGGHADFKDIFETWRLRTPNDWDNFSVWNDLLQWRNHMYNTVINSFKDFSNTNTQIPQLGYGDKAWSINKLARLARKQGLYDVCVTELNKNAGYFTTEVQERFVKIREQAKTYLEMRGELRTGINLINSTNLENFPSQQQAEIFRLKGEYFQKMNNGTYANEAYSNAIGLSRNLSKGWISWGNYCDQVYKESNEELLLESAVRCFLEGIKYGISNARTYLARVLYLLSFDTINEPAGKAFDNYLDQIPHWVWLSWIPQLLLSLQRPEASHCKLVLLKIATDYPQALYYCLQTYLIEHRNVANKSELGRGTVAAWQRVQELPASVVSSSSLNSVESNPVASHRRASKLTFEVVNNQLPQAGTLTAYSDGSDLQGQESDRTQSYDGNISAGFESFQSNFVGKTYSKRGVRCNAGLCWKASEVMALEAAMNVMDTLKNMHRNLACELQVFLNEIGKRFIHFPEEKLLSEVHALVHRCYKYPTVTTAEVPKSLKNELSKLCRDFFPSGGMNENVKFVNEYKRDFERDLDPASTSTFPATLSDLTERLRHWKNVLQINVEDRFSAFLKLEEESNVLNKFHVVDMEVPGQYLVEQDFAPDHSVKLDRIGADLQIVRRHGSNFRRLTLVGSDGSRSHFLLRPLTPGEEPSRMGQLFRDLNRLFDKHKESRRRHLAFHTPIIIPVWPQVCMVEDDLMYSTFGEVYENSCARRGLESDLPIIYFKESLNPVIIGQFPPESVANKRLQIYNEIISGYGDYRIFNIFNIFNKYMQKILPNFSHLAAFRKQFAVQLALSSFISYMLQIGGRTPDKTLFAKNTGKIFQNNFNSVYDANGMIEFNEAVPFRLTPNLQYFLAPSGVEGHFVSAMCAAAQSVVAPKRQHVQYHLEMFFRDELLSWSSRRPVGMSSAPAAAEDISPVELKQKVTINVEQVIGRIKGIAPQCFPEEDEDDTEPPQSVQRGVTHLVKAAVQPKNLCMMDPTWHPWF